MHSEMDTTSVSLSVTKVGREICVTVPALLERSMSSQCPRMVVMPWVVMRGPGKPFGTGAARRSAAQVAAEGTRAFT